MDKINFKNLPIIVLFLIIAFVGNVVLGRVISSLLQLIGVSEMSAGLLSVYLVVAIIALEVFAFFNEFIRQE